MFSLEQQKEHRLQLANILEQNVVDDDYSHLSFSKTKYKEIPDTFQEEPCGTTHCAGDWAATYGIGGLVDSDSPHLPDQKDLSPSLNLEIVFGKNTYKDIFSEVIEADDIYVFPKKNNKTRNQVINELRTWEPTP